MSPDWAERAGPPAAPAAADGQYATIDLASGDLRRCYAAQIEQSETEGGVKNDVCRLTAISTPNQIGSTPMAIAPARQWAPRRR